MDKWEVKDIENSEYIGLLEIEESEGIFEVVQTEKHLVFGSSTNIGLLQSGFMKIDPNFSLDENLQALIEEIETYYRDGKEYCIDIVCNERM